MPDLDPGTQMVLLFFVLLFLRVPVAFALAIAAWIADGWNVLEVDGHEQGAPRAARGGKHTFRF